MSFIVEVSFVKKAGCKVDYCLQCDILLYAGIACEVI